MHNNEVKVVGRLTKKVIDTFLLPYTEGAEILCGISNLQHIRQKHPGDYLKYGDHIADIIREPDYIAKHPLKPSIEYIKVFTEKNGDHVLVVVRASGSGTLFIRTLFVMDSKKVAKYHDKSAFISYTDEL